MNQERVQTDGYAIEAAWRDMREQSLQSALDEFFASELCVAPSATQGVTHTVPQYVSLFLRAEEPHARQRIKATKDANAKRQEEELKAEEAFQGADLRQVIGMAAIEAARMNPGKRAQQVISHRDTLGHLFKDQPDLTKNRS